MIGYIYSFKSPSGKYYIGITNDIRRRIAEHKRLSKTVNRKFYIAIRKYGFDNFEIEVLEKIRDKNIDRLYEKLNKLEEYYIAKYDSFYNGYNLTLGGDGTKGASGELNPFYGKKHSKESKEKMRNSHKGKKLSDEHKKKISDNSARLKQTPEMLKKQKQTKIERGTYKKVICLETNKIYDNITDCALDMNISRKCVSDVCNGKRMTASGYKFRFIMDGKVVETNRVNLVKKKVVCNETGQVFDSVREASLFIGAKEQHISAILNGRQKTTKGYSFSYYSHDNTVPS